MILEQLVDTMFATAETIGVEKGHFDGSKEDVMNELIADPQISAFFNEFGRRYVSWAVPELDALREKAAKYDGLCK